MPARPLTLAATLALGVLSGFSCADRDDPVTAQIAAGETLFELRCLACHETDDAEGPRLTEQLVRSYGSARALFDYTQMSMPWDAPGTLSDEEYWRVTAYLVASRNLDLPHPLDSTTADSVRFY